MSDIVKNLDEAIRVKPTDIEGLSVIYHCVIDMPKRCRILENTAEQYAVCDCPEAQSGIVVFGYVNGKWEANACSMRPVIKMLLAQVKADSVCLTCEGEKVIAVNPNSNSGSPIASCPDCDDGSLESYLRKQLAEKDRQIKNLCDAWETYEKKMLKALKEQGFDVGGEGPDIRD